VRKKELNDSQKQRRQAIAVRLKKAGWSEAPENSMFEAGDFVEEELAMTYEGKMQLTASYSASDEVFSLIMEVSFGGPGVTLRMKCWDKQTQVLDVITAFQDKVTNKNFRDYVVKLVDICPDTKAVTGDGQVFQLDNKAPRKKR
jgi:hypothetical protein